MAIYIKNVEADTLTRRSASMAGVSITEAIAIAMKEAIERHRELETPMKTAARLRRKHGVILKPPRESRLPVMHSIPCGTRPDVRDACAVIARP